MCDAQEDGAGAAAFAGTLLAGHGAQVGPLGEGGVALITKLVAVNLGALVARWRA